METAISKSGRTTLNPIFKSGKVPETVIGNMKSNWVSFRHTGLTHGHLMSRNAQQPTCRNAICENQRLTVKHCLRGVFNARIT